MSGVARFEKYSEDVQKCMRCGFCRALCPTFDFVGWEVSSPRGRMQLVKRSLESREGLSDYAIDKFYKCATCGYCLWRCPPGVRTIDVIREVRSYALEQNKSPADVAPLIGSMLKDRNVYGRPPHERMDWVAFFGLEDLVKTNKKGAEILYFPGCLAAYSPTAMKMAQATALILNEAGSSWTTIGAEEWCCGNPLLAAGDTAGARQYAEHNLSKIADLGVKTVLTSCAGCYRVFTKEYPTMLGETGLRVYHTSQWLDEALKKGRIRFNRGITAKMAYHDPCELGRLSSVFDPPRQVIRSVPGATLKELPKNRFLSRCCGAGGILKVTNPDIALKLSQRRLDEARGVEADTLVSACPACEVHLLEGSRQGYQIRIMDVTEIAAEAMGLL